MAFFSGASLSRPPSVRRIVSGATEALLGSEAAVGGNDQGRGVGEGM